MGKPIDITRLDLSTEELRKLAAKAQDGRVVRRLLGISLLLEELLSRLRLTRLQPRPYHPKKDPEAETAFKKTS
jgi:hypothetical protein